MALPSLSEGLQSAYFSGCQIRDLSQTGPHTLERLDLRGNPIDGLLEWVFQLRPQAKLRFAGVHMPDQARRAALERVHANAGPWIIFEIPEDKTQNLPTRPMDVAAAAWFDNPADAQATQQTWLAFATEHGAPAFSQFLDRLALSINHLDSRTYKPFREGVQQLLADMARGPQLRADCYDLSVEATESCEDRVTLRYQQMAVPRLTEAGRGSRTVSSQPTKVITPTGP